MVKCSDHLSQTFAALADPGRRQIVTRLARGSASVSDLAAGRGVSLPAIMKHLAALERAGLVRSEKAGRVRRCRLTARPMRDASAWLDKYRALWDARLDRLAEHLRQTKGDAR
ncbi:MAG: winged helix-turn-helix transcriptional regulator [Planctomycetia bacterium]|nr:winged helix-turn-helix transcriptional regulator [Planctomycetia bacterium]